MIAEKIPSSDMNHQRQMPAETNSFFCNVIEIDSINNHLDEAAPMNECVISWSKEQEENQHDKINC